MADKTTSGSNTIHSAVVNLKLTKTLKETTETENSTWSMLETGTTMWKILQIFEMSCREHDCIVAGCHLSKQSNIFSFQ